MKNLCIIFLLVLISACGNLTREVKLSKTVKDPTDFQEGASDFRGAVNNLLKAAYPSKLKKVYSTFSVTNSLGPVDFFHLNVNWYAEIEPTDSANADYYFNSVGTLSSAEVSEVNAIKVIKKDSALSAKVKLMIKDFDETFGNHYMPNSFISTSTGFGKMADNGKTLWWCINEYFCTAKKQ